MRPPIVVGMTGASGAVYGVRLLQSLLQAECAVGLVISRAGAVVLEQECGWRWQGESDAVVAQVRRDLEVTGGTLRYDPEENWFSPWASGSGGRRQLVVCPCSMRTLAAIAHGLAGNLIHRGADVALKERWPLVLVPRESPLSPIHLENMLRLSRLGATILPAAPGFYHHPRSVGELVDFVVAKVLDHLGVPCPFAGAWPRPSAATGEERG